MAVSFTDSIIDGYVWSLERPMYLRYSKDVDNSAVVVSIAITQGSYSKTLTLKYSGLIKEIEMNISSLIKAYFQHMDYAVDRAVLSNPTNDVMQYSISRTQKAIVTITDDDNSITTTQFFVKNANNDFRNIDSVFGENNYNLDIHNVTEISYLDNGDGTPIGIGSKYVLNFPIVTYINITTITSIVVTRKKINGTTISTETLLPSSYPNDKIVAVPIGNHNGDPGDVHPAGIEVNIDFHDTTGIVRTQNYTFNYVGKCDITLRKIVYYEGRYGGIEYITFANQQQTISKSSNKFTLQNGDKIALNLKNRVSGSVISEYLRKYQDEAYKSLFLSEKVQMYREQVAIPSSDEVIDILLTSKSHRIKQIDNSEMKQYTFAYEEVEQLKY